METRSRSMAGGPALGIVDLVDAGRRNVLARPDDTTRAVAVAAEASVAITVSASMLPEVVAYEGRPVSFDGTHVLLGLGFLALELSHSGSGAFELWRVG